VHSYISNSKRRYVARPWVRLWIFALIFFVVILCTWETILRKVGHRPSIVDDVRLWSLNRRNVYYYKSHTPIVLLGASRMQLGFVPQMLDGRFDNYRVVNLAIDGAAPVATLRDLAGDKDFNGIVICAITAAGMTKRVFDNQISYVEYYHKNFTVNDYIDRRISTIVQSSLVSLQHNLRLDEVFVSILKNKSLPSPYYLETFSDRSKLADYSQLDIEQHRKERIARVQEGFRALPTPSPEQWLNEAMEIERYVEEIHARGGKVVFVRFPTTDEHWELDEDGYPKAEYWDNFASKTGATTIHFKDFHKLSQFDCPDTSHLDRKDAPYFTEALVNILESKGILDK